MTTDDGFTREDRISMDGTTFDQLIKRIATKRITRLTALRGLAAGGVATLTGVGLITEEARAKKNNNNDKKKRVCNCTSADPATCLSQKKKKKARNRLLRSNPCAYKGRCQTGVSGCAAPLGCSPATNTTQGSCLAGQICSTQAICVAGCTGTTNTQGSCPSGQVCVIAAGQTTGQCQNQALGCSPNTNTQGSCLSGQICNANSICVPTGCLNTANPQCNTNQICCPVGTASAGLCRGNLQAC